MYAITQFGAYTIPTAGGVHTLDGHPIRQQVRPNATGGITDRYGLNSAPPGTFVLNHDFVLYGTSTANAKAAFDTLRALVGTKAKLYRTWDDASRQWVWARLINVDATRRAEDRNILPITAQFEILSPYWWAVNESDPDSGIAQSVATSSFSLTGGGGEDPEAIGYISINNTNSPDYHYLVITIANSGDSITEALIENTGFGVVDSIQWAGTLATSTSLIINTFDKTITNNGQAAYSEFIQNHAAPDWFALQPGGNLIAITLTGTSFSFNTTATIDLYEGFH